MGKAKRNFLEVAEKKASRIASIHLALLIFLGLNCQGFTMSPQNKLVRAPAQSSGSHSKQAYLREFKGSQIDVLNEWLDKAPRDNKIRRVLKFLFQVDQEGKPSGAPYFINPEVYAFHWQLVNDLTVPKSNLTYNQIEKLSYPKVGRKYFFGAVSIFDPKMLDMDIKARTTFQLTTEEIPPTSILKNIQSSLQSAGIAHFSGDPDKVDPDPIEFTPTGNQIKDIESRKEDLKLANIPIELDRSFEETSYTTGWGVGKLVVATNSHVDLYNLDKNTIVITDGSVTDLPPVAGIISTVPLTPASHLVFLAQMYGIPLVYLPTVRQGVSSIGDLTKSPLYQLPKLEQIKKWQDRWVFLKSDSTLNSFGFSGNLSEKDAQFLMQLRPALKLDLVSFQDNESSKLIRPTSELNWSEISNYGGKAVQMGQLFKILSPKNRPEAALGIPLGFYKQHIKSISTIIREKLSSLSLNASYLEVAGVAQSIQKDIVAAPILPEDLNAIAIGLKNYFDNLAAVKAGSKVKLKFRSSSNVEDGEIFNGAGLYDSKGMCFFNCGPDVTTEMTLKKLEDTIKFVWASFYNPKAYWARRQFGLTVDDELTRIGMGINVNPSIKNEIVNGVATARWTSTDELEVTVVEAKGGDESGDGNNQITHSAANYGISQTFSPGDGSQAPTLTGLKLPQLMSPQQYFELHEQMRLLYLSYKKQFPNRKSLVIESEFKVQKPGDPILLKQVRRIPTPLEIQLPDKAKYSYVGGTYYFHVDFPVSLGIGAAQFSRPRNIAITVPTVTSKSLAAGEWRAGEIQFYGQEANSGKEIVESCGSVIPKIDFQTTEGIKFIKTISFNCTTKYFGPLEVSLDLQYDRSSTDRLRSLYDYLTVSHLTIPKSYEEKIYPEAAEPAKFNLSWDSTPRAPHGFGKECLSPLSQWGGAEPGSCNEKLPQLEAKSLGPKIFLKLESVPLSTQGDYLLGNLTQAILFRSVFKGTSKTEVGKWEKVGKFALNSQWTFRFQKLHDGLNQFLVDIPNASQDLAKALKDLGFQQRYLWSPFSTEYSNIYLIGKDSAGKGALYSLNGQKTQLQKAKPFDNDEN